MKLQIANGIVYCSPLLLLPFVYITYQDVHPPIRPVDVQCRRSQIVHAATPLLQIRVLPIPAEYRCLLLPAHPVRRYNVRDRMSPPEFGRAVASWRGTLSAAT